MVEHDLAKVGVEGSNPFARSKFSSENQRLKKRPSGRFLLARLSNARMQAAEGASWVQQNVEAQSRLFRSLFGLSKKALYLSRFSRICLHFEFEAALILLRKSKIKRGDSHEKLLSRCHASARQSSRLEAGPPILVASNPCPICREAQA